MQKEIQLTDKTLLVVGLPKEAKNINVIGFLLHYDIEDYVDMHSFKKLPSKGYELLGIYPELTEEQVRMVVEANEIGEYKSYKEHFTNPYFFGYKTALESFQSLMEREQCYTVNPLKFDPTGITTGEWQEAQQRTFSKYAILIKSK